MTSVAGAGALRATHAWELGDWVAAVAWDVGGRRVAAACADGTVPVLDLDREAPSVVARHAGGVTHVAWSADGVLASAGEDACVRIGEHVVELDKRSWPQALGWRPDGGRLLVAAGRHVRLFERDGRQVASSAPLPATVSDAAWRPRGVGIVAASYGGVRLLQGRDLRRQRDLKFAGSVLALTVSPDGRRLAHGNQDASVHFWDLRKDVDLEMYGYTHKVRELAWRRDGRLLATGGASSVTVWDFAGRGPAGSTPLELDGHERRVTWLGFSPTSSLLASASADGRVLVWDPPAREPVAAVTLGQEVSAAAWSPDGRRLALGGAAGAVVVADATA